MFKSERTWAFWVGLIIVASASIVLFSTLWSAMFVYPLLADPRFVLDVALNAGMQPRSVLDGHDWNFFQAYSWLSDGRRNYFPSDYFLKLLVPPVLGASIFILIGLYMMRSGTKKKKGGKIRLLSR